MFLLRRRRLLAAIAGSALLVEGSAALAQPSCPSDSEEPSPSGEMTFSVQQRPGRRPVLIADGVIDQNVVPRLQAALADFRGDEIWLRSPGGYVGADRDAGRLIRASRLRTRIPSGWICRGACNFMFMGGIERVVEADGHFIVRMFAHTGDLDNTRGIAGSSRGIATDDYDYLIRMGVLPRLLDEVMYREPADGASGRCLTRAELADYRVTTGARR